MDTSEIIYLVVAILVLLAIAAAVLMMLRKKRRQQDIEHATRLRQEAEHHATDIPQTRAKAKEAEAQAEQARLEAERAEQRAMEADQAAAQTQAAHEDRLRTADRLDPHVDTKSEDYRPDTGAVDASGRSSSHRGDPDTVQDTVQDPDYVRAVDADGRPVDDRVRPVDGTTTDNDRGAGGGSHRA
jgi:hypothetical protein